MFQCSVVFCPTTFLPNSPAFITATSYRPLFCDVFAAPRKTTEHLEHLSQATFYVASSVFHLKTKKEHWNIPSPAPVPLFPLFHLASQNTFVEP